MKKYLILFSLFFWGWSSAQTDLYVGPNSYVYSNDVVLYVEDAIQLEEPTSYIYLRGDAQLIQNNDVKNQDIGQLSIYQESTTEIYEYNYWCSPVGVGIDGILNANVPFDVTNVYDPADEFDASNVLSTPFPFTTANDATLTERSSRWIYKMQEAEGYNGWVHVGQTGNVPAGYGFTMKGVPTPPPPGTPNNTIDLRGRPNNGTMTIAVNYDGTDNEPLSEPNNQVSTLTGNPYPSAIDLKLFFVNSINNQNNLDGNIYFWEQQAVGSHNLQAYEGGYALYTPGNLGDLFDNGSYAVGVFQTYNGDAGGNGDNNGLSPDFATNSQRRYAAVGQGFLVNSDVGGSGGNGELLNSMRLFFPEDSSPMGTGSVFRNPEEELPEVIAMSHNGLDYMDIINNPTIIPEVRIHTKINDLYFRESLIAFREGTDLSYNKFTDARTGSLLNSDAYMRADDHNVIIKSIAYDLESRIPFCLQADGDNIPFNIKVFSVTDVDDIEVFVYDNITDSYTDIRNGEFNIALSEGEYCNRFEITFLNQDTLNNDEIALNDFMVFQDNNLSQLSILNPNGLDINEVQLIDVNGKVIFKANILEIKNEYHFSTKSLSVGVYLATVSFTDRKGLSKKIIVNN
ncbi:MAG: T9SS type A sorting domain-containing protein [Flavobacteriaceae bacterium]|nr:MAG: T9SS type A sorting domain-containing protein [Flavobacteriaceae bacterium]